jgi:murein L,D-transpeptidase YcbB/YkuD
LKKKNPKYLTEAHKKNSEAAIEAWNNIDPSKIDWEAEKERQKKNARNH